MKLGTKSLLFGVHQFVWHPFTVWRAWVSLYGEWPTWRETLCIIVHDWGYWGCETMDGADGARHPIFGSKVARRLLGREYESLVLLHSRELSRRFGLEPSRLCWPDKLSMMFDPPWFYLLRARLTGEIEEYHWNAIEKGFIHPLSTDREWLMRLREHLRAIAILQTEASG